MLQIWTRLNKNNFSCHSVQPNSVVYVLWKDGKIIQSLSTFACNVEQRLWWWWWWWWYFICGANEWQWCSTIHRIVWPFCWIAWKFSFDSEIFLCETRATAASSESSGPPDHWYLDHLWWWFSIPGIIRKIGWHNNCSLGNNLTKETKLTESNRRNRGTSFVKLVS